MNNANEGSFHEGSLDFETVTKWTTREVEAWLRHKGHNEDHISLLCNQQRIDGKSILLLTETDLRQPPIQIMVLGDLKRLYFDILELQQLCSLSHHVGYGGSNCIPPFLFFPTTVSSSSPNYEPDHLTHGLSSNHHQHTSSSHTNQRRIKRVKRRVSFVESASSQLSDEYEDEDPESSAAENVKPKVSPSNSSTQHLQRRPGGYATTLDPEIGKALTAMAYVFCVTWLTALAMVIVHDRVPDMQKFPPLPDLFLDNMPHIPWAFEMCEVTGSILFCIFLGVLFFHKHRFILIRRFFALSGTVFLLRCVTMLITSLSVPGTHLKCNPRVMPYGDWLSRLYNAYLIWKGAGLSIQGVRTCGDYMFSGHTVALTMLNFFITEYTTRRYYFIHTFSWVLNMFGIFFILAAHEHYSIDVFIAFYITSRLFLYYHTLANNHALMQRDSKRTKVWFPLFSFFESKVDGIVPNQYEWPITPRRLKKWSVIASYQIHSKWKEIIPNPSEGFFRTKMFFKPLVKKDE